MIISFPDYHDAANPIKITLMKKAVRQKMFVGCVFILGVYLGALMFSGVQPRSILTFHRCNQSCLQPKELFGLIGSVVVQRSPRALPRVLLETEKTVVIEHPSPLSDVHYVAIPKKDIRNAFDLHENDLPYLADTYAALQYFIDKEGLSKYTISTNGPGYQQVDYLHFHLRADR